MPEWIGIAGWVHVTRPLWLIGLLAVAAPVVLAWLARRRKRRIGPAAVAAQCLALALAALALAGPRLRLGAKARLGYLLMIDGSGSVRGQAENVGRRLRDSFPAGSSVDRFYFADGLFRLRPGSRPSSADRASRIGPALRMAASGGRAGLAATVIATDGRFSDDDWAGAAAAVARRGGQVLIVPMNAPAPDSRVAELSAERRSGNAVEIAVTVVANAACRQNLTVAAGRGPDARVLLRRSLALLPQAPASIRLADSLPAHEAAVYAATLADDELINENNAATTLILPVGRKIAAVSALGDDTLRRLLGPPAAQAVALAPRDLPADPDQLAEFAAVVLADPAGSSLSPAQRRGLAKYVRGGGGLLLIGTGPHDTPADADDPLNRTLPLLANPFQRRPLHLIVLLDRSGSMDQPAAPRPGAPTQRKFDLAAEAVVALKRHLTPRDALTVITFAGSAAVAYDSGDAAPSFDQLADALRAVRAAGSTRVTPALAQALQTPPRPPRQNMILVLSDLATEQFDPQPWVQALRQGKVRLAVVAVGEQPATLPATAPDIDAADPPLRRLTQLLGPDASYVQRDRLAGLARVFGRLVRAGRGSAIKEGPARLVAEAPLFDTALTELPPLDAYVLSALRPGAQPLARTDSGDPILARRQVGLGRSVGLAIPIGPGQNEVWQKSPAAGELLAAATRWTLRPENDPRFHAALTRQGDALRINVTARRDDAPWNDLSLTAAVGADDAVRAASLDQIAPGQYETRLACPADLPAGVVVRNAQGATVWRGAAAVTCPEEFRRLGAHRTNLRRLAELTAGKIVSADQLRAKIEQSHIQRMTALWPWLLAAALAVMLAEWCTARITRR